MPSASALPTRFAVMPLPSNAMRPLGRRASSSSFLRNSSARPWRCQSALHTTWWTPLRPAHRAASLSVPGLPSCTRMRSSYFASVWSRRGALRRGPQRGTRSRPSVRNAAGTLDAVASPGLLRCNRPSGATAREYAPRPGRPRTRGGRCRTRFPPSWTGRYVISTTGNWTGSGTRSPPRSDGAAVRTAGRLTGKPASGRPR